MNKSKVNEEKTEGNQPNSASELEKQLAEPLLPEEMAQVLNLDLRQLHIESPIDAALIEMRLPPEVKRDTVQLARQSVADWNTLDGKMRTVDPAVVLWGLLAQDSEGSSYQGSLIGVEGGAQIDPVVVGVNVLALVNRSAGGGAIATDEKGLALWRRAVAPLADDVLLRDLDLGDSEIPEEIAQWLREKIEEDAEFNIASLYLGKRALVHVTTHRLYRIEPTKGDFQMNGVGPLVRSESNGYGAFNLGGDQHPWRGEHGEATRFTSKGIRDLRMKRALERPAIDKSYRLPGLIGDIDDVVADADDNYAARRSKEIWRDFLPPPDKTRSIAAAKTFVDFVNSELLDLQLPNACREPQSNPPTNSNIPYTARIRDLPFWDCYELVEITERLGGRRRKTNLLWAKDPKRLPGSEGSRQKNLESVAELEGLSQYVRRIVGLDGDIKPIRSINRAHALVHRLKINERTARPYAEFFCTHLQHKNRNFAVLEHPDDVDWKGFHHMQRDAFEPSIFPMRLWSSYGRPGKGAEKYEQGDFVIEASLTHKGGLFRSIMLLKADGEMDMLVDFHLISDLDVRTYGGTQKNNWLLATFPEVS